MGRQLAVFATVAMGALIRILVPRLPFSSKPRHPQNSDPPKVEEVTDDEDSTSTSSQRPSASRRAVRASRPVLCSADVLAGLDSIAPHAHRCPQSVTCVCCHQTITAKQFPRITPCHHHFHSHCLQKLALEATNKLMNSDMYSVARDGTVRFEGQFLSCPECREVLDVVPRRVWIWYLLSAVAQSLQVEGRIATHMYRNGMVIRDNALRGLHVRIPNDQVGTLCSSIDLVGEHERDRVRATGLTPVFCFPARTRSEQRGFGRADTYLAASEGVNSTWCGDTE